MIIGRHFFVAIHALTIIAVFQEKQKITSTIIADSTGLNPVTIRNTFRSLKAANLIRIKPGPGGVKLAHAPEQITLYDIYNAVEEIPLANIFHLSQSGAPDCPVGRNITNILASYFNEATALMGNKLSSVTLADIIKNLQNCEEDFNTP